MATKKSKASTGDTITGTVGDNSSDIIIGKDIETGEKIVTEGDVTSVGRDYVISTPNDNASKEFATKAEESKARLEEELRNYQEVREQAKQASTWNLIASVIGLILVAVAVVLYLTGNVTSGAVTAIVAALTELISVFFARQAQEANNRLDQYHTQLMTAQRQQVAIQIVESMEDGQSKNQMIQQVLKGLLPDKK